MITALVLSACVISWTLGFYVGRRFGLILCAQRFYALIKFAPEITPTVDDFMEKHPWGEDVGPEDDVR